MLPVALQQCVLLFMIALNNAQGAPSWPVSYAYSPDSMPIVQIRLAPPRKSMPEVAAVLSKLDTERKQFERDRMLEAEVAYNVSLKRASQELPALIDRLMRPFTKPAMLIQHINTHAGYGLRAMSFHESRSTLGGHELSARINILPIASPNPSLEININEIETKRASDEGKMFDQAILEMAGLTQIVANEVEAQIIRLTRKLLHALKFGASASPPASLASARSTGFLTVHQPVRASGPPLTTNVRVMASEQPFDTLASMMEGLERKRDASEDLSRKRLLELELKLLQTENRMVSSKLDAWIEGIQLASV